jgi:hypothetical protein
VVVPRPPLDEDGSVPYRNAGPTSRFTTRRPGARYTITRFTDRDLPAADFGSHTRHPSAIDDSCQAVAAAKRRWLHFGAKRWCVVLDAELVSDPLIGTRLASLEVISITQLSCRRLLISLVGESPWEFDCSAGQDLLLMVANDGASTDYGRYLIKRFDPRTRHLDIEAVLEPDGPAARWAATVVPGEPVAAIGPREDQNVKRASLRVHPAQGWLDSLGLVIPRPALPVSVVETIRL